MSRPAGSASSHQPPLLVEFRSYSSDVRDREEGEKRGLLEWYRQIHKKEPDSLSKDDICQSIINYYKDKKNVREISINLVVVGIDAHEPTESFLNHIKNIDDFLDESRTEFLTDTIEHLGTLTDRELYRTRSSLCEALMKARKKGHFDDEHIRRFDELITNEPFKGTVQYLNKRQGIETATRIHYNRPADRSR